MIVSNLRIPVEKDGPEEYLRAASKILKTGEEAIKLVKILSRVLDISNKEQFYYEISLVVNIAGRFENKENFSPYTEKITAPKKSKIVNKRPIIIGFGPAGMFAALELVERGIRPLIFERGRKIEERGIDVRKFINERVLDTESNIQFGEGGAGSYSDGKLFSRGNNSSCINKVLETFIKFGAPEEIGYAAKPHVGTDILCKIVKNIRNYVLERGGEIHYSSKMTDILISDGKAAGVVINDEKEYLSSIIFLAVGHSARDTFEMIHKKGIFIEQKAISVGVRVEHPVEIINLMRYGEKYKNFRGIGAAAYSFNYTDRGIGRSVNTFCMCPGGEVVNASSENGLMVINGMSYAARSSAFSNSAIVVTCHTGDYESGHPLAGIEFQTNIERKAFESAGETWKAPAQNLTDFLRGRISENLNKNSFKMGCAPVDMNEIFQKFICDALTTAFNKWKEEYPLFVSDYAILLAPETRTSCPVKITRGEKFESANIKNLYPIGEGSGYTGGITSSAADAIISVEKSLA